MLEHRKLAIHFSKIYFELEQFEICKKMHLFSSVLHEMEHALQAVSVLQRAEPQVATVPQGK